MATAELKELAEGVVILRGDKLFKGETLKGNLVVRPIAGGPYVKARGQDVLKVLREAYPKARFLWLSKPVDPNGKAAAETAAAKKAAEEEAARKAADEKAASEDLAKRTKLIQVATDAGLAIPENQWADVPTDVLAELIDSAIKDAADKKSAGK